MQKYTILILSIFFIGCTNQHNKKSHYTEALIASLHLDSTTILNVKADSVITVNLNPFLKKQNYDLGSLIEEVKFIPLETTDESLLDNVYKILVTESNIYIYDKFKGGGIIIFDREGKFVKRMPHGQGPGEIFRLWDMAYDWDNKELVAYQHPFLLFFTPSGDFIRQERLPFGFHSFVAIPDGYVFKTLGRAGNEHLEVLEDYTLLVTDKKFKLKSVAMPTFPNDVNYGWYYYLHNNDNTIKITQRFTDTIYQYAGITDGLKAKYAMDYSKKKLPERYLQGSFDEFERATCQDDYYYYLGEYFDTKFHHAFILMNDYTRLRTIIYRNKKSGNLQGGTYGICDGVNGMPSMRLPVAVSGEYFLSLHFPNENESSLSNSSIVLEEDKKKIKNLKEDDNPVLVFFKLKNF
jgi:hypothetical protein